MAYLLSKSKSKHSRIRAFFLAVGLLFWIVPSQATSVDPFGVIIVKKISDPANDTTFNFGGDLGRFQLSDPSSRYKFGFAKAGQTYTVFEHETPGWKLDKITTWSWLGKTTFKTEGNKVAITLKSWDVVAVKFHNVAVPIPGAVWLLGSGLLALVGIGRSRRQKAVNAAEVLT